MKQPKPIPLLPAPPPPPDPEAWAATQAAIAELAYPDEPAPQAAPVAHPKERPILMRPEMVRAILADEKTVTRRPFKVQPERDWAYRYPTYAHATTEAIFARKMLDGSTLDIAFKCPYGKAGDHLWVREAWNAYSHTMLEMDEFRDRPFGWWSDTPLTDRDEWGIEAKDFSKIVYRADNPTPPPSKWIPSIFMPRAFSRLTLRITDIRAERIQDITDEEAIKEGVKHTPASALNAVPRNQFAALWESIHGKGAWDKNEWVWVIHFEKAGAK